MEKRTLLALSLSFLVIGFYPVILQKFYPDYQKKMAQSSGQIPRNATSTSGSPAVQKLIKPGAFSPDEDLLFRNDSVSIVFNKKDGGIREIAFPHFPNSETERPIQFISLKSVGLSPGALVLNHAGDTSTVMDYRLTPQVNGMVLESDALGGKVHVTKSILFGKEYAAGLKLRFENTTEAPLEFSYELLVGSGIAPRHSIDSQYIEANFFSVIDGKNKLRHVKESRSGKIVQSESTLRWAAVKDRHFSVILMPKIKDSMTGIVRGLGNRDLSASLASFPKTIPPHGSIEEDFVLYVGPNELDRLLPLGLEDLVNFGKFDWIGRLCVGALELIQKVFKNYGLAVIVLTSLINLMLFPFTRVSYMSMKRMQLIQPQVTKLREHNKKNPEKLNRETMELYKKHKVNPFGGCLPMVLQIPIFISLYVALSKSVNLINARFLWVRDLSSPDRIYLPVSLPFLGDSIHLLPLLMVCAMALQQRFTQIKVENQDPQMQAQQKMMAVMMPVIFGFIFYQMPASLVLYWLTNTVLMSLYQLRLKNMTLA